MLAIMAQSVLVDLQSHRFVHDRGNGCAKGEVKSYGSWSK